MSYSPNNYTEFSLDFTTVPTEAIGLLPEHIESAIKISNSVQNSDQRWLIYLHSLALFGFVEWVRECAPELSIHKAKCSVLNPTLANLIPGVCNLEIGDFKICLVVQCTLDDREIYLPRVAIDLPEFIPHFYVIVSVREEYDQVIVKGFIRYDKLTELISELNLQPNLDWTYSIPSEWIENETEKLLLYLRCLAATAINLPEISGGRLEKLASIQAEISSLLNSLISPDVPLWEVLNWEQLATIISLEFAAIAETETEDESALTNLDSLLQILTRPALNVGLWLQDKMDELAQDLAWILMPAFVTSPAALRSTTEEFQLIVADLLNLGVDIPTHARGAYQKIKLSEQQFNLYAVTWPFLAENNVPEWMLLLILGANYGSTLPTGLKLRVSDSTGILVQRKVGPNSPDSYLYIQIAGAWDERFLVTVSLPDRETGQILSVTLPPFTFRMPQ
ncbi:DUF1822 family protein [Phormidium sp. LEGE 05292]|uniref:DUF1822 family protein n=1 Tax=[Phormidium] sp. LEGE 05292 TaxID=767427 RepID=UPI0018806967|nr:DUF1822 family protein [Phormidium sp. LEGE 05292]MBE9225125.1 DUF1822 family protein [Phormidium sp. LEGE 05292]